MAVNLRLFPPIQEINDVASDFLRKKLLRSRNAKKNIKISGDWVKNAKGTTEPYVHTMAVLTESMIRTGMLKLVAGLTKTLLRNNHQRNHQKQHQHHLHINIGIGFKVSSKINISIIININIIQVSSTAVSGSVSGT